MSNGESIPPSAPGGSRSPTGVEQQGVTPGPVYVTAEGLDLLRAELGILIASNGPELFARIGAARKLGAPEDGELGAIREELTIVEGLILHLHHLIRDSVVIDFRPACDMTVSVGARVRLTTVSGQKAFQIVGRLEADPSIGLVSNESPVGQALLGHRAGDQIVWRSSDGFSVATVLSVEWSSAPGARSSRGGTGGSVN
jgi:transcription elongation factor GreA